jgi:hypothetical protein
MTDLRAFTATSSPRRPDKERSRSALAREVEAERWTRLDAAIRMAAVTRLHRPAAGQSGRGRSAGAPCRRRPAAETGAHGARHACRAGQINDRS